MKRNIEPPESSDEESKVLLKKAKKEKYGKRKKTESESSETDDWNNKVNSGCQSVEDNDCDRNVEDGSDGSSKEIGGINLSSEFHSVEEISNIDSDSGTGGSKEIGEISLSSGLDFLEGIRLDFLEGIRLDFLEEISNIDLDTHLSATSDGSTYIQRTFCCVKNTLNNVKDFDDGGDGSTCSCQRRQDRNDERNRGDSGAGSNKGTGTNNHSPQPHSSGETHTTGPQFESYETAVGDAFIERGESKDNDHDISSEFHSFRSLATTTSPNVAYFENLQGDEGEDNDDGDESEEFHSFCSGSIDPNAGNGQIAENGELIDNSFGSFHSVAENNESIRSDDRSDSNGAEDSDEIDEVSDESGWSLYDISSDDEGYRTAENVYFSDAEMTDEESFSELSDS